MLAGAPAGVASAELATAPPCAQQRSSLSACGLEGGCSPSSSRRPSTLSLIHISEPTRLALI
eukprot:9019179-Alexandrium_andersonii.AAC.1